MNHNVIMSPGGRHGRQARTYLKGQAMPNGIACLVEQSSTIATTPLPVAALLPYMKPGSMRALRRLAHDELLKLCSALDVEAPENATTYQLQALLKVRLGL